jgi:hypothetical protein
MTTSVTSLPARPLTGTLHVFVAFDWGEEARLDRAEELAPGQRLDLPRRRRTPPSIAFSPSPLRFGLGELALELPEIGSVSTAAEAALFDFAGVSVSLHVPFACPAEALTRLAGALAEPAPVVDVARAALRPLYEKLRPAIHNPWWEDTFSEEYFVFHLPPAGDLSPALLTGAAAGWLARLLRLEANPLSEQEITEALRLSLSYTPEDLFVADWAAAVLVDRDCDETLRTIEYTNLQLLEYRHIDTRLDKDVARAYQLIQPLTHSWLPFWRMHSRQLRMLGELKVEANELFERTGNVFKLVGDQYLARVYSLLARRFHLDGWEQSIERKLRVLEGVYEVLSDQTHASRGEVLEIVVVLLILIEIVLAIVKH